MFYNAKNGAVTVGNTQMSYISFGKGEKTLIMLPGLGDGLKTVKGTALPFAFMYRKLAKRYTVYCFSRKDEIEHDCTIKSFADDTVIAMENLGIKSACILGVSMGGMIAQYIAAFYPERVEKLILAVTTAASEQTVQSSIDKWLEMVEKGDHASLMKDNVESIYTEEYIKKKHYKMMYPFLGLIGKPKSYNRFIYQANACKNHDATEILHMINAKTLIIGGGLDKIVGKNAPYVLNDLIDGSKTKIYPALGHGAYEEAKDFLDTVIEFIS